MTPHGKHAETWEVPQELHLKRNLLIYDDNITWFLFISTLMYLDLEYIFSLGEIRGNFYVEGLLRDFLETGNFLYLDLHGIYIVFSLLVMKLYINILQNIYLYLMSCDKIKC